MVDINEFKSTVGKTGWAPTTTWEDGFMRTSIGKGPAGSGNGTMGGSNRYHIRAYKTPFEREQEKFAEELFRGASPQLLTTPEGRADQFDEYGKAYYDELMTNLNRSYEDNSLAARESFNARGLQDSSGYEDYRFKNLDRAYLEATNDASNKSIFAREDLFDREQNRLMQQTQLANAMQQQLFNNMRTLETGQVRNTDAMTRMFLALDDSNFNRELSSYNANLKAAELQMKQDAYDQALKQQQQQQSGGWMNMLGSGLGLAASLAPMMAGLPPLPIGGGGVINDPISTDTGGFDFWNSSFAT